MTIEQSTLFGNSEPIELKKEPKNTGLPTLSGLPIFDLNEQEAMQTKQFSLFTNQQKEGKEK